MGQQDRGRRAFLSSQLPFFGGLFYQCCMAQLRVLFTHERIQRRVGELAAQIERDFAGQSVIFVGVLKGATIFLSDLARRVHLDATFDFIGVASYGRQKQTSGEVRLTKDVEQPLTGSNLILVEDILDTGLTMSYLRKVLMAHQPHCLKIAALLDKESRRIVPIKADYVGFSIPDEFVVGYGMDYAERYRNLPDICVLPPEMI
jgi:hypoxanthine phosphoribosyltransferase